MTKLPMKVPQGFGVRQSSGAFRGVKSGRGLPQSKTLSRGADAAKIFA